MVRGSERVTFLCVKRRTYLALPSRWAFSIVTLLLLFSLVSRRVIRLILCRSDTTVKVNIDKDSVVFLSMEESMAIFRSF